MTADVVISRNVPRVAVSMCSNCAIALRLSAIGPSHRQRQGCKCEGARLRDVMEPGFLSAP